MSKDEHGLTPLQAVIKETLEEHPAIDDDKEIAKMVFNKRYPDEEYQGKDPSHTYVGKIRRRIAILGKAPEFYVEEPEEPQEYEIEEPEEPDEPEIPFKDDFEPPLDTDEPFKDFDPDMDFTQDDTEFLLTFTFDKFADWSGYEGWRFSTDSKGNLIDASEKRFAGLTHRMMNKYMPDIFELYFLEVMFCYTGIMLLGTKGKGYMDYRRRNKPVLDDLKDVESEVVEKAPPEEPTEEVEEETPEEYELPPGTKALGESGFMRRLRRQTP